jgi:hypothetical protein
LACIRVPVIVRRTVLVFKFATRKENSVHRGDGGGGTGSRRERRAGANAASSLDFTESAAASFEVGHCAIPKLGRSFWGRLVASLPTNGKKM